MREDYKITKQVLTAPFKLEEPQYVFVIGTGKAIYATCAQMAVICANELGDEFILYIADDGVIYRRYPDYEDTIQTPRGDWAIFIFTRSEFENTELRDRLAFHARQIYGEHWRSKLLELLQVCKLFTPHSIDAIRNHYSRIK